MVRFADLVEDIHKVVSVLTQVEARSAICRLRREKKLTPDQASFVLMSLDAEIKRIRKQPITPSVLEAANAIVERHSLRAMDAVQLGCAVASRASLLAPNMRFVASDKDLLLAAKMEGFDVWNPCDGWL